GCTGICGQFATGTCRVTVSGKSQVFSTLQAAVNAAPNGPSAANPTIIHVSGVCKGPTLLNNRSNITIEGDRPAACPPGPADLTSTLMGDPSVTPPSGSNGETVKTIKGSKNIVVRYLNIVNNPDEVAIESKASTANTGDCNCIAFHKEGFEL